MFHRFESCRRRHFKKEVYMYYSSPLYCQEWSTNWDLSYSSTSANKYRYWDFTSTQYIYAPSVEDDKDAGSNEDLSDFI